MERRRKRSDGKEEEEMIERRNRSDGKEEE